MTCWAVIPVKGRDAGKSRLVGVLDDAARGALVRAMLRHVTDAAAAAANIDYVAIVGSSRLGMPEHIPLLADPAQGLNFAVQSAAKDVARRGATRFLIVAGDLPLLTAQELELLAAAPDATVAMAPDRHGVGTNAISLPLPGARDFTFRFGDDSFAKHHAEAKRLGLSVEIIRSTGLARDIDEPSDLADGDGLSWRDGY